MLWKQVNILALHYFKSGTSLERDDYIDSKIVEDIDFSSLPHGKDAPTRIHYKSYDLRPSSMQKTTKTELEELTEQLNTLTTSCGFYIY